MARCFSVRAPTTHRHDYLNAYIADLANVLDMDAIRGAKISMGVDPPGGCWKPSESSLTSAT